MAHLIAASTCIAGWARHGDNGVMFVTKTRRRQKLLTAALGRQRIGGGIRRLLYQGADSILRSVSRRWRFVAATRRRIKRMAQRRRLGEQRYRRQTLGDRLAPGGRRCFATSLFCLSHLSRITRTYASMK